MTRTPVAQPKLLFLESLPTISGGQSVLLDLAGALRGRCQAWALLPGEGPLAARLRALGVDCRFAPVGRYSLVRKTLADAASYGLRLPWLTFATWRLITSNHIDLVYANSGRTFIWGTAAAALAGRPILWHQHNVLADEKSIALVAAVGRLPAMRRLIAVSGPAVSRFPALAAKTVIVPNGIDTQRFRPDRATGAAARLRLGLPSAALVVGMVGDLLLLKSQHTLVRAAGPVSASLPEAHFVFVGRPRPDPDSRRYAAELEAAAAGLAPRVLFAGHQDDMPAVLNALDLLVVASSTETVPLVLLEALACGVPVVSTPVGRAPELLADGVAGRLFPVGDAGTLAEIMVELLASPTARAEMSKAARALAEARFPLARALDQIIGIIDAELPANAHLR